MFTSFNRLVLGLFMVLFVIGAWAQDAAVPVEDNRDTL